MNPTQHTETQFEGAAVQPSSKGVTNGQYKRGRTNSKDLKRDNESLIDSTLGAKVEDSDVKPTQRDSSRLSLYNICKTRLEILDAIYDRPERCVELEDANKQQIMAALGRLTPRSQQQTRNFTWKTGVVGAEALYALVGMIERLLNDVWVSAGVFDATIIITHDTANHIASSCEDRLNALLHILALLIRDTFVKPCSGPLSACNWIPWMMLVEQGYAHAIQCRVDLASAKSQKLIHQEDGEQLLSNMPKGLCYLKKWKVELKGAAHVIALCNATQGICGIPPTSPLRHNTSLELQEIKTVSCYALWNLQQDIVHETRMARELLGQLATLYEECRLSKENMQASARKCLSALQLRLGKSITYTISQTIMISNDLKRSAQNVLGPSWHNQYNSPLIEPLFPDLVFLPVHASLYAQQLVSFVDGALAEITG